MRRAKCRRWIARNPCCRCERRTYDYKRHGTTSLFATLDVKAGTIVGKCMARHRAAEFRKFLDEVERNVPADLDVHVVMDNYGTHKTKLIRDWFAKRPSISSGLAQARAILREQSRPVTGTRGCWRPIR
jgi:GrpB-like predicted nucleotidyltransferase (UPF0157 family)